MIIEENNLTLAWAKALLKVYRNKEDASLIVTVKDIGNGEPREIPTIRDALDSLLASKRSHQCDTVANTIFPSSLWVPEASRENLYERYKAILPRLRKHKGNRYGLYFERLIAYGSGRDERTEPVNQLEHIIQTWHRGNRRRSALKAAIFDPFTDHTNQPRRGFPCLHHVSFTQHSKGLLAVTGVYATQNIVEKAYGNYLGLHRLGIFMAREMELKLDRLTCVATPAVREPTTKGQLRELVSLVNAALS